MADLSGNDAAGTTKVIGSDASGVEQTPVQSTSAGGLHSNLRNNAGTEIATSSNPLRIDPTGTTTQPVAIAEFPTFSAAGFDIAIGNNKSMLSIQNTGTAVVRIREIWIINDRTTAVTGVAGEFQVNRITSFTGGTTITPVQYDTDDVLPAGLTCATGATVVGENTNSLRRGRWSTDEWGPGTLDVEGLDHGLQQIEPFWKQTPSGKALTIRQNQGIHVKFATNSTAGAFTIRLIFTTE